jgi:hypothetical protein
MRRPALAALILGICALVSSPPEARACSFIGPVAHVIDSSLRGVDHAPPTLPKPVVSRIAHHDGTGCMSGDSCGDFTSVEIRNLATDDMTPTERIGYRFVLVAGALPSGFTLPEGVVDWALPDASVWLMWSGLDGDFDFTLQLVAFDAAGNQSAPETVRLRDDAGGCSVGRGRGAGELALTMAGFALAKVVRRSRRRKARPRQRG